MFSFFAIFFVLYIAANLYLLIRAREALTAWFPQINRQLFSLAFWLLAIVFPLGHQFEEGLSYTAANLVSLVGYTWLAVIFYGFFIALAFDVIKLIDRFIGFLPTRLKEPRVAGILAAVVLVAILAGGAWNASSPKLTRYTVDVNRAAGGARQLHIVMVSDLHLGAVVNNGRLSEMVRRINAQKPDLVVIPGDLMDENAVVFEKQQMAKTLRGIRSKYGVYASLGNHDDNREGGSYDKKLADAGIVLLKDRSVQLGRSFYLAGRAMQNNHDFNPEKAVPLRQVLGARQPDLPVILLDHAPTRFAESAAAGVDLLLSGHTHRGQIWPINYLTERMYVTDYGMYSKGGFHAIVSDGFGTWGPPLRIGNRPEIVDITVHFAPRQAAPKVGGSDSHRLSSQSPAAAP